MFFFGIRDCTRKFLASVNCNLVAMVMILLGIPLQLAGLYLFQNVFELELVGIGLACILTNGLLMVALDLYARFCVEELQSAYNSSEHSEDDDKYKVFSQNGINEYLTLGWPSVFSFCCEAWTY